MRTFIDSSSTQARAWSGRPDLNRRPSAPKADALPDCATPRAKRLVTRAFLPAVRPHRKAKFRVLQWVMFDQTPEEGRPGRAPSINVLGGPLQACSADPLTGFYRDGCCNTG